MPSSKKPKPKPKIKWEKALKSSATFTISVTGAEVVSLLKIPKKVSATTSLLIGLNRDVRRFLRVASFLGKVTVKRSRTKTSYKEIITINFFVDSVALKDLPRPRPNPDADDPSGVSGTDPQPRIGKPPY